ncbi:Glycerol dehydrogenase, partial [human gut metagenome]
MRTFASPSRYIQGEDALFENAKQILNLGNHPV